MQGNLFTYPEKSKQIQTEDIRTAGQDKQITRISLFAQNKY